MAKVNTPAKSIKERVIAVPQKEYAAFLQWQKKMRAEIKDVDEAITVAKNEKANGKLKLARSFSAILKPTR
ncbi:MAG: hypothetical protein Q7R63_00865 [bacterium]|nr:hypothetical protein [bacterium]